MVSCEDAVPLYPENRSGVLTFFTADVAFYYNVSDPCSESLAEVGRPRAGTPHGEASYWTERFAEDETLFKAVFQSTWLKMMDFGNDPAHLQTARRVHAQTLV